MTPCDEWPLSRFPKGYGQQRAVRFGKKLYHAHVIAWVDTHGHLPDPGKQINHTCNNPPCRNPEHLYEGTQQQNMQDKLRTGNHSEQKKLTYKCGHEKIEENTYWAYDRRRDSWNRSCVHHRRKSARDWQREKRAA